MRAFASSISARSNTSCRLSFCAGVARLGPDSHAVFRPRTWVAFSAAFASRSRTSLDVYSSSSINLRGTVLCCTNACLSSASHMTWWPLRWPLRLSWPPRTASPADHAVSHCRLQQCTRERTEAASNLCRWDTRLGMPAVPRAWGATTPSASLVQKRAYERSNCVLHSDIYHASERYSDPIGKMAKKVPTSRTALAPRCNTNSVASRTAQICSGVRQKQAQYHDFPTCQIGRRGCQARRPAACLSATLRLRSQRRSLQPWRVSSHSLSPDFGLVAEVGSTAACRAVVCAHGSENVCMHTHLQVSPMRRVCAGLKPKLYLCDARAGAA